MSMYGKMSRAQVVNSGERVRAAKVGGKSPSRMDFILDACDRLEKQRGFVPRGCEAAFAAPQPAGQQFSAAERYWLEAHELAAKAGPREAREAPVNPRNGRGCPNCRIAGCFLEIDGSGFRVGSECGVVAGQFGSEEAERRTFADESAEVNAERTRTEFDDREERAERLEIAGEGEAFAFAQLRLRQMAAWLPFLGVKVANAMIELALTDDERETVLTLARAACVQLGNEQKDAVDGEALNAQTGSPLFWVAALALHVVTQRRSGFTVPNATLAPAFTLQGLFARLKEFKSQAVYTAEKVGNATKAGGWAREGARLLDDTVRRKCRYDPPGSERAILRKMKCLDGLLKRSGVLGRTPNGAAAGLAGVVIRNQSPVVCEQLGKRAIDPQASLTPLASRAQGLDAHLRERSAPAHTPSTAAPSEAGEEAGEEGAEGAEDMEVEGSEAEAEAEADEEVEESEAEESEAEIDPEDVGEHAALSDEEGEDAAAREEETFDEAELQRLAEEAIDAEDAEAEAAEAAAGEGEEGEEEEEESEESDGEGGGDPDAAVPLGLDMAEEAPPPPPGKATMPESFPSFDGKRQIAMGESDREFLASLGDEAFRETKPVSLKKKSKRKPLSDAEIKRCSKIAFMRRSRFYERDPEAALLKWKLLREAFLHTQEGKRLQAEHNARVAARKEEMRKQKEAERAARLAAEEKRKAENKEKRDARAVERHDEESKKRQRVGGFVAGPAIAPTAEQVAAGQVKIAVKAHVKPVKIKGPRAKSALKKAAELEQQDNWACCSGCEKWRILPRGYPVPGEADAFFCYQVQKKCGVGNK